MPLGGAKDELFSCFLSSCELGLMSSVVDVRRQMEVLLLYFSNYYQILIHNPNSFCKWYNILTHEIIIFWLEMMVKVVEIIFKSCHFFIRIFFCQINIRSKSCNRKISMILVNKVLLKLKFSKNVNNTKHAPKWIFIHEKKWERFGWFLT